jgi:hypothetical protein
MSEPADEPGGTLLVGGGLVLAVLALIWANTGSAGDDGFTLALFIIMAVLAAIAAAIYFFVLRRTGTHATLVGGLVVAIVAVISAVVAYWSGLPLLLGAAAVAMGRHAPNEGRLRLVVQVLGALAIVVAAVVLVGDKLS